MASDINLGYQSKNVFKLPSSNTESLADAFKIGNGGYSRILYFVKITNKCNGTIFSNMQGFKIFTSHFSFSKGTEGCALLICESKPRKQEIMDITGNRFDMREKGGL